MNGPSEGDRLLLDRADFPLLLPAVQAAGYRIIGPPTRVTFLFDHNVLPEVTVGQSIATHLGFPAVAFRPEQEEALRTDSMVALDAANEALPGLQALQ